MLRVAIIGTGTMGQLHAESFARIPGLKVIGTYCDNDDSAVCLAQKYGAKPFNTPEDLFHEDAVDIVVVCTPTPTHSEYAIRALEAGKHVFLEKPMARNWEDGQKIFELASKARAKFMVGHVVRFHPEYRQARELLRRRVLGRIGVVRMARRARFPMGWGDWYADPAQSGGVILDMLIHDMDYLRWCFGRPKRVYARGLLHCLREHIDYALVVMRFRNGVIAHLEGSWAYEGEFHTTFEIAGDKGLISFHSLETAPLTVLPKQGSSGQQRVALPTPPLNESPYLLEVQHFVECIRKDRRPAIGAEEGLEALRMALAALESAETGEVVEL